MKEEKLRRGEGHKVVARVGNGIVRPSLRGERAKAARTIARGVKKPLDQRERSEVLS